mgnify:CR=1 FL=1
MTKRFASACIVAMVGAAATIVACGGGDDGGGSGGGSDASVMNDGNVVMVDAPGSGSNVMGLGQMCTPDNTGSGQGDCPAGYVCLAVQGATHPWCSKPCATGAGDMCGMGYTGPGVAANFSHSSD